MTREITVKIFIDVFIGVWSLVLAWVWTAKFDKTNSGRTMNFGDVLARFPRFVLGYLLTFVIMLYAHLRERGMAAPSARA